MRELSGRAAADLLEWWMEAGVDVAVADAPRNWLKPPARHPSPDAAPVANVVEPSLETLGELRDWLASSVQLPLASSTAKRILPHGPENAAVMLLSDAPALEDFATGQPIGGEAWQLTERMLSAIGIRSDEAYSASLSCFHAPGAIMSEKDRADCAEIARKHIGLAKPKRLILFGDGPARALLGQPVAAARGHIHKVEGVRTIATIHPRQLLKRPEHKRLAWQDLLLLMEEEV